VVQGTLSIISQIIAAFSKLHNLNSKSANIFRLFYREAAGKMIESDASFGLHAIVSAAIMDEFMIDEKRLFDYTQMSMRADGLYYTVFFDVC